MSWRDNLRPASLGGVSFFVESAEFEAGRNTQVFEYPKRDKPYVEDLGRAARRLQIECLLLSTAANGYDYMQARDALLTVIETAGPTQLVHPYYGEMRVSIVGSARVRESTREGGSARITLSVVESGELTFPTATTSEPVIVQRYFTGVIEEVGDSVDLQVSGLPDFVGTAAADLVRDVADRIGQYTDWVTTLPEPMADFVAALGELADAASQLILVPQSLVSSITGIFGRLTSIVAQPKDAIAIVGSLFDYGEDLPAVPATTPSRLQQATNQQSLTTLVQVCAVATASQAAVDLTYDSANDALAMRDTLRDALDGVAERVDSDTLYRSLVELQASVVNVLEQRAAQLALLTHVTLPESTPSLVLAYCLYGDANRGAEIVARNQLRDPYFLPSGVALEVLANV